MRAAGMGRGCGAGRAGLRWCGGVADRVVRIGGAPGGRGGLGWGRAVGRPRPSGATGGVEERAGETGCGEG